MAAEARQGHDDPGLTLKQSSIEVRCDDDAFELVLRTDDEDLRRESGKGSRTPASRMDGCLRPGRAEGRRSLARGLRDRIELCVRLVKALVAAEL